MYGWLGFPALGGAGAGLSLAVNAWLSLACYILVYKKDGFYDKMRAERDAAEDRVDKMMESARGQADNILKNARMTAETVFDELETLKKKAQKKNAAQNLAAAKAALRGVISHSENVQRWRG